jgi:hypothetical protein
MVAAHIQNFKTVCLRSSLRACKVVDGSLQVSASRGNDLTLTDMLRTRDGYSDGMPSILGALKAVIELLSHLFSSEKSAKVKKCPD